MKKIILIIAPFIVGCGAYTANDLVEQVQQHSHSQLHTHKSYYTYSYWWDDLQRDRKRLNRRYDRKWNYCYSRVDRCYEDCRRCRRRANRWYDRKWKSLNYRYYGY